VDQNPQAIALRAGERSFTYQELDRHANALASLLMESGVKRETLVGVCAERRAETLIAILAVLKSGGAYVPIDPKYPADRIAYILNDAKAPILLTQRSLVPSLPPEENSRRLFIDNALEHSADRILSATQPDDLAYVIYTSGSTGLPKGVAIEHRNAIALIGWAQGVYSKEELAGVLFSTSICFDLSIFEMFVTLASGGAVILAENALDLRDHPHRDLITLINTVPSAITELVDADLIPASVKVINLAGEALTANLVDRLYESTSSVKVYDLYGPSEDTTYSTFALRQPNERATIGRPISNTKAYIVSPQGKLLPPGVSGELLLGGAGLARGYLNRPQLTAEKFITFEGTRLYRTGDRARFFENGDLQFLGRLDHQIKLRGYRIELGEIESLLEKHPAIEQAVTHVHDGKLVAYLRQNGGETSDGTGIWQDQWDMLYQSAIDQTGSDKLDRLDSVIAGWAGVENLDAQVTEWIDTTVERIRSYGAKSIFEIGCGTGQILAKLAAESECYWAADISKVAIDALEKNHPLPQVKLFYRPADDFSDIPDGRFDTVIINSVAQYFPDAAYLSRVLAGAAKALKPGGRIFLGDIQGNALLATHHASALQEHAPAGTTCGELREKVAQRIAQETELSLDPAWFGFLQQEIPSISHVETQLRRGKLVNETTTYHYDVILHVGPTPATRPVPDSSEWKNLNLEQLEAMLVEGPDHVSLIGIPDARLAASLAFRKALESATSEAPLPAMPTVASNAVSAEDLFALAAQCGYHAHIRWHDDGTDGLLDAVFFPLAEKALPAWPAKVSNQDFGAFTNTPKSAKNAGSEMAPALRKHLAGQLPEYMIPSAFVVLDAFPLTPNGKVDRKALPAPASYESSSADRKIVAPRNETETKLLEIWKQVLGNERIGIEDDIFELGGDSILIFQITTRATRAGIALTPAQVFRLRTISAISSDTSAPAEKSSTSTIQRVNRDAYRRNL
jgi:amino acid adenylation domain-containing protein